MNKYKYVVKDSQNNIIRVFYNYKAAYSFIYTFGNNRWSVKKIPQYIWV